MKDSVIVNRLIFILLALLLLFPGIIRGQEDFFWGMRIPRSCQKLLLAYPDFLEAYVDGKIKWKDGSSMTFDDRIKDKSFEALLNHPDLEDQMSQDYPLDRIMIEKNYDPGRIRYEPFFKKMYGSTKAEVEAKLDTVFWLPSVANRALLFSRVNGAADSLQKVSLELDRLPALHPFLYPLAGTYNWRRIAGTDRLSAHSFGICIDINVPRSHYWRWDRAKRDSSLSLSYHNDIPMEIVRIFEKYGFIWGGKWYHYDTMHFEFRPELIIRLPISPKPKPTKITAFEWKRGDSIGATDVDPTLGIR